MAIATIEVRYGVRWLGDPHRRGVDLGVAVRNSNTTLTLRQTPEQIFNLLEAASSDAEEPLHRFPATQAPFMAAARRAAVTAMRAASAAGWNSATITRTTSVAGWNSRTAGSGRYSETSTKKTPVVGVSATSRRLLSEISDLLHEQGSYVELTDAERMKLVKEVATSSDLLIFESFKVWNIPDYQADFVNEDVYSRVFKKAYLRAARYIDPYQKVIDATAKGDYGDYLHGWRQDAIDAAQEYGQKVATTRCPQSGDLSCEDCLGVIMKKLVTRRFDGRSAILPSSDRRHGDWLGILDRTDYMDTHD